MKHPIRRITLVALRGRIDHPRVDSRHCRSRELTREYAKKKQYLKPPTEIEE